MTPGLNCSQMWHSKLFRSKQIYHLIQNLYLVDTLNFRNTSNEDQSSEQVAMQTRQDGPEESSSDLGSEDEKTPSTPNSPMVDQARLHEVEPKKVNFIKCMCLCV